MFKQISQMSNVTFAEYFKRLTELRNLSLKKIAEHRKLNSYSSCTTENGVGVRPICYLKPLNQILNIHYKNLLANFFDDTIYFAKFHSLENGLNKVINQ